MTPGTLPTGRAIALFPGWHCRGHYLDHTKTARRKSYLRRACLKKKYNRGRSLGRWAASGRDGNAATQKSPVMGMTKGQVVHLPVDYAQFLGLRPGEQHKDDEVTTCFEHLSAEKMEEGYSARADTGRQEILERAREEVIKSKKTKPKEGEVAETIPAGVEIEPHLAPGAIALLVQVGEFALVMDVVRKMLESKETSGNLKRDLLLSMALAKLGICYEVFETPQVALAVIHMEEALKLLQEAGDPPLAKATSNNIIKSLPGLAVQCVQQQLSLPLELETAKGRRVALDLFKSFLTPKQHPRMVDYNVKIDRHFVKESLDQLTGSEMLTLADWPYVVTHPKQHKWYYPGVLNKVAVAHIVVAFVQRRPPLLRTLDNILSMPGNDKTAHIEHMVCKVLLGEIEEGLELLNQVEGRGKDKKDKDKDKDKKDGKDQERGQPTAVGAKYLPGRNETLAFIIANSGDGEDNDLLPGICLFTERWIHDQACQHFRDMRDWPPTVSLSEYFDDKRVSEFLNGGTKQGTRFGKFLAQRSQENPLPARVQLNSLDREDGAEEQQEKKKMFGFFGGFRSGKKGEEFEELEVEEPSDKKPPPIMAALAGGVILGAALFAYVKKPWVTEQLEEPVVLSLTDAQHNVLKKVPVDKPMPTATAEKIVKRWQSAKSYALGPKHEVRYVRRILDEPLLDSWVQRIQDITEQGWYWKYKLYKCKVSKVDASAFDGGYGHVTVHASLRESATMYREGSERVVDKYKSSYTVSYKVILDASGRWRINEINVASKR